MRSIGYATWLTVSNLAALVAGLGLLSACINSSYSEENRAPVGRIVVAAIAFVVALPTAVAAIRRVRGKPGRIGLAIGIPLTAAATLLVLLMLVVDVVSGRL